MPLWAQPFSGSREAEGKHPPREGNHTRSLQLSRRTHIAPSWHPLPPSSPNGAAASACTASPQARSGPPPSPQATPPTLLKPELGFICPSSLPTLTPFYPLPPSPHTHRRDLRRPPRAGRQEGCHPAADEVSRNRWTKGEGGGEGSGFATTLSSVARLRGVGRRAGGKKRKKEEEGKEKEKEEEEKVVVAQGEGGKVWKRKGRRC